MENIMKVRTCTAKNMLFCRLVSSSFSSFFSRVLRDSTPRFVSPSVRPSVGPSVTLLFFGFCGLWPHCSCPNYAVTSSMTPAHPHATGVAVYAALFKKKQLSFIKNGLLAYLALFD